MIDEDGIRQRWEAVGSKLNERGQRLFAAAEVRAAGWGLARSTINRGEDDLDAEPLAKGRVRRFGGGRRSVSEKDPETRAPGEAPGRACDVARPTADGSVSPSSS